MKRSRNSKRRIDLLIVLEGKVKSLVEKAKKYLRSAEILLKEGDYESSVSRTYYAMFYCAQAMLLTKNLSFSSHKGVISAFGD